MTNFKQQLQELNAQLVEALDRDDDTADEINEQIDTLVATHLQTDIDDLSIEYPNETEIRITLKL